MLANAREDFTERCVKLGWLSYEIRKLPSELIHRQDWTGTLTHSRHNFFKERTILLKIFRQLSLQLTDPLARETKRGTDGIQRRLTKPPAASDSAFAFITAGGSNELIHGALEQSPHWGLLLQVFSNYGYLSCEVTLV
nr:hypothetical protein [Corynebacterium accolens]